MSFLTLHSFKIYGNALYLTSLHFDMQNLFMRTSKKSLLVAPDLRPDFNMSWA